jgi:hypothetical protein
MRVRAPSAGAAIASTEPAMNKRRLTRDMIFELSLAQAINKPLAGGDTARAQ